jgi:hypothetical protein
MREDSGHAHTTHEPCLPVQRSIITAGTGPREPSLQLRVELVRSVATFGKFPYEFLAGN